MARAAPDKETAGYDGITTLAADILSATFVSTDRQGDAFKNMNNLHQGRQFLSTYHLKINKALREHACYDITYHNTVILNNGTSNYTWAYSRIGQP